MNRKQKRDRFIENLDTFRLQQELNDGQFAEILGEKRENWNRWKNGKMGMGLKKAWELVEKLSVYYKETWKLPSFMSEDGPPKLKEKKRK
jgi:hypothetical protein